MNPTTYSCENGKYLASITEHTVIKRDETITKKTVPATVNEKSINFKIKKFYILLAFFLITIALLIAANF